MFVIQDIITLKFLSLSKGRWVDKLYKARKFNRIYHAKSCIVKNNYINVQIVEYKLEYFGTYSV